jgi:hypothetical protein
MNTVLRLAPAFNIRLVQDVWEWHLVSQSALELWFTSAAKVAVGLVTEVDDAGVCAPTLPVENPVLQRVAMRDIVFHNRLEAESVARNCKHLV